MTKPAPYFVPWECPAVHQAICESWCPSAQYCKKSPASSPLSSQTQKRILCFDVCARMGTIPWTIWQSEISWWCQSPATDTVRTTFLAAVSLIIQATLGHVTSFLNSEVQMFKFFQSPTCRLFFFLSAALVVNQPIRVFLWLNILLKTAF